MFPPGGIPLSRRVYLLEHEFSMDFAGLEKLRIPKAIATPPRKLKMLANLGNPEQLDVSENVEQTRTTRKRRKQK